MKILTTSFRDVKRIGDCHNFSKPLSIQIQKNIFAFKFCIARSGVNFVNVIFISRAIKTKFYFRECVTPMNHLLLVVASLMLRNTDRTSYHSGKKAERKHTKDGIS